MNSSACQPLVIAALSIHACNTVEAFVSQQNEEAAGGQGA